MLGLSVCLTGSLANAGIVVHGSTTAYQESGGDWLTMGTNDKDGSGGLGSDGYIFFGDYLNNGSSGGNPFTTNVTVAPSVRSNLTTILGRTAALRRDRVSWDEMMSANEELRADLTGLRS